MVRHRWWTILGALASVAVLSGCNRFGYDAHLDRVGVDPTGAWVRAEGWLHDPLPARNQPCPAVRWTVDGERRDGVGCPTFGARPDVDGALGGANAGIRLDVSGLTKGRHEVCVDVVPTEAAATEPFRSQDCGTVDVPWDQFDHSALDQAVVSGSTVDLAGWYAFVTRTSSDLTWSRTWTYDGLLIADIGSGPTFTTTVVDRPDAAARYGPWVRGVTLRATAVPSGRHEFCLGLRNPATNFLSGVISCRTVTV